MRQRWLSGRAFVLHGLLVVIVPACLLAGWWQVHRALSGNLLSYLYSIEWPAFAVIAVFGWWQLIHDVPLGGSEGPGPLRPPAMRFLLSGGEEARVGDLEWDATLETPELRAYNDYLATLAKSGGRKTWANPKGLPDGSGTEGMSGSGGVEGR